MTPSRLSHGRPASEEGAAWAGLAVNLLVLPGAGSLMSGRKVGWAQTALALAGFALTAVWLVSALAAWVRAGEITLEAGLDLRVGLAGIAVFAAAWLWSLATSVDAIRRARGR
jgi:hypothetical protein